MVRRIAIIGAGQTGLLAAHGLLRDGHEVTLVSGLTPEQFLTQVRPTGAAGRFAEALDYEHELGLDHWDDVAPLAEGACLVFCRKPRRPLATMAGRLSGRAYAVDLRLQSARWMEDLTDRGGSLIIEQVDLARLDEIAGEHDLTIVAAGRGDLADLFERDEKRSSYSEPARNLAMAIVKNLGPQPTPFTPVKINILEPHGEIFWVPFFHKDEGPTWAGAVEAIPGGELDRFSGVTSGKDVVELVKELFAEYFPWEQSWFEKAELADENGWLTGSITPTVRHPVGTLPSGRAVIGIGDTVISFDPIVAQGANTGNRMAKYLVRRVRERGDEPFDTAWMRDVFDTFYADVGEVSCTFTNLFLEPMTSAGKRLLISGHGSTGQEGATGTPEAISNALCDNFADPRTFTNCMIDTVEANRFLSRTSGRPWIVPFLGGLRRVLRDQLRQKLGLNSSAGYWP